MERKHLEHLIRAASSIVDDAELVIVGSQSVLGQFPDAPDSLKVSMEADMYPSNRPELADLIEGSIGEGSPFEQTFGYYAQGVSPGTAILPRGWEGRLTKVQNENTRYATGYCIDVHDLVLSKYVANRPKDIDFNREVIRSKMVEFDTLINRVELLPVSENDQKRIVNYIRRDFGLA
ncbi:MAG TPA: DUF6036 family nucleotidyltransferase [Burkholderiales bacterium]|nr:DUF6036 family nucleotidyltransferase [Burkholderiales bacterium]